MAGKAESYHHDSHARPGVMTKDAAGKIHLHRFWDPMTAEEYHQCALCFERRGIYREVRFLRSTSDDTLERLRQEPTQNAP